VDPICACVYVRVYVCMYVCRHGGEEVLRSCVCVYVCMYVCVYFCVHGSEDHCWHVDLYTCTHIHTHMHTYIQVRTPWTSLQPSEMRTQHVPIHIHMHTYIQVRIPWTSQPPSETRTPHASRSSMQKILAPQSKSKAYSQSS
jgi:hypothetical protein